MRTADYIVTTAVALVLAYLIAVPIGQHVSQSLTDSANLIQKVNQHD